MPAEEYHRGPELSYTALGKFINKTPLHYHLYRQGLLNRETKSMAWGTDAHCAILEPERFSIDYAIGPECARNKKEWKEFAADNNGKRLLKPSEHKHLLDIKERVRISGQACRWIIDTPGETEVSFFWKDEKTGMDCRCRVDKLIEHNGKIICVDVKTCQDASNLWFYRHCMKMGYFGGAYFYSSGLQAVTGKQVVYVFLAIEKTSLIGASYTPGDEVLTEAGHMVRGAMAGIKDCEKSGRWPAYSEKVEELS